MGPVAVSMGLSRHGDKVFLEFEVASAYPKLCWLKILGKTTEVPGSCLEFENLCEGESMRLSELTLSSKFEVVSEDFTLKQALELFARREIVVCFFQGGGKVLGFLDEGIVFVLWCSTVSPISLAPRCLGR